MSQQQFVDPTVPEAEDLVDTTELIEVSSEVFPPEGPVEQATESAKLATISRQDVLLRAQSWIDEHVLYSQTKYHANKFGRYRQDCSGYISMCWHLPTSYTTATIIQVAHQISWTQLLPGDALWHRSAHMGHIALFVGWADKAHTKPVVDEEYQTGHPCTRRVWSHKYASGFTPIRYNHVT